MVSTSSRWHSTGAGQVASTARYVWTFVVAVTAISFESTPCTVASRLEKSGPAIGVWWVAVVDDVHCVGFVKLVTAEEGGAHIMRVDTREMSAEAREAMGLV